MTPKPATKSPNPEIDKHIKKLLSAIDTDLPISEKAKVLAMAIQWEKVKNQIMDSDNSGLDASVFGD